MTQDTMQHPILTPLQTEGRFREAHIEQQAYALLKTGRLERWRLVSLTNREAEEWVQEETLVCLLRTYYRQGDRESAWRFAEILIQRTAAFLSRHTAVWHLPPHYVEECIRDTQEQLISALFNLSANAEFWEVRFWLCLKRRLLNVIQKYKRITEVEFHPNDSANEEEPTIDKLATLPDKRVLSSDARAEIADALAQLKVEERVAFYLFHYEDWGQQDIADQLQVSERTVRNLLTRAERRLAEWRSMAN